MNVLIGLTIILVLMLSENGSDHRVVGAGWNTILLLLCTFIAPLFAAGQVLLLGRKLRNEAVETQQGLARWLSVSHTAVWIVSSLVIVVVLQWHQIVRQTWHLDQIPLFDEIMILTPVLVSLIVSWLIFFELQKSEFQESDIPAARFHFVSIRCRVYLLLTLIPVFVLVAIKDLWQVIEQLPPVLTSLLSIGVIVLLLCLVPLFIGLLWSNRAVSQEEGREELIQLCAAHKLQIRDIRVWDTGNQVVNAVVTGILPRFRLLMVSDLLLNSFPDHELRAILRHEAGHVRLHHLPIRIGFILLPALALTALELDPNKTLYTLSGWAAANSGVLIDTSLAVGLVFLVYVVCVTAWLSRNMEMEADLYAIGACAPDGSLPETVTSDFAHSMSDALLRFASQNPDQYSRRSLTHPSLFDRIHLIRRANADPSFASRFRLRFAIFQCLIAIGILMATTILLLI